MFAFESDVNELFMDDMTVTVTDLGDIVPPHTVIQVEDPWKIVVRWRMSGDAHGYMAGKWVLNFYYEGLGGAPDGELPDSPLKKDVDPMNPNYEEELPVAGNTLPAGTYRLVTTIGFENIVGDTRETQAFSEGPLVRIYEH